MNNKVILNVFDSLLVVKNNWGNIRFPNSLV